MPRILFGLCFTRSAEVLKTIIKAGGPAVKWLDSLQHIDDSIAAKTVIKQEVGGKNIFEISTLPAKILFDKEEITLPANTGLTIRFNNPDEMPHNLIIIKPGSLQKVGKAAEAMATMKDGSRKGLFLIYPKCYMRLRSLIRENRMTWILPRVERENIYSSVRFLVTGI